MFEAKKCSLRPWNAMEVRTQAFSEQSAVYAAGARDNTTQVRAGALEKKSMTSAYACALQVA